MPRWLTVIADDEPLVRERIRALAAADPELEVSAELGDGESALAYLRRNRIDLLLLDVRMPRMDGFALLEALDAPERPVVVFITAHDEYALRAFDVHALDYLLKPFDRDRFESALGRAKQFLAGGGSSAQDARLSALLAGLRKADERVSRLAIKQNGRIVYLDTARIDWIGAADNYVRVHAGAESYLVRETMNEMERRLNPSEFIRIHRSTIVRADRVRELRPWFHGEHQVILRDGTELMLSRARRERLESVLGPIP
jgi:two-component system LytT family response regulator